MEDVGQDTCFGAGSVAGAVIGTFLTTILLLAVAALLYRQWRRHKGKHLVLVTDPEIVDDAYAFDNPCFKDATPAVGRVNEKPLSAATTASDTPAKHSPRWSTPWTTLGLGSAHRSDKRRTLDDSCLGPKATRVSVISLRSRDFTGLGFNVCGNMREGIFVKDLLHRGPASESGRIHPGDRIASVKISFRNMVYEDALTILSYASPYDVELEVESGGSGSKPTTLLKKTVGPSPGRICHPLYRSQSIPELSHHPHRSVAKRLFIADPNESVGSNYSTMNSTTKSSKPAAAGGQTLERRHEDVKSNHHHHHHKFGIKVLPALDGTVHRIETQNEHNTNLERRHSKKADLATKNALLSDAREDKTPCSVALQKTENPRSSLVAAEKREWMSSDVEVNGGIDVPDEGKKPEEAVNIPSEVPAEVHNAAMAARRNRKSSSELLAAQKVAGQEAAELEKPKSPQKNKRKAPAPPKSNPNDPEASAPTKKTNSQREGVEDTIDSISDYTESLSDYVNKVRENTDDSDARRQRLENQNTANRRNSESDTDSEVQNSFTTIELNPSDITIHRTPVPEVNDEEDDMYRKAASLGDLSKYENKTSATLERAQSLDMTDTGSKKRKAPLPPPEDITESTEDLTKLDQIDTFDRRKLKKSSEWGTLEDAIWSKGNEVEDERTQKPRARKRSNGTLERSKSAVEIKLKEEVSQSSRAEKADDVDSETSIELYNLPLSKRLTQEFIHSERMFDPGEDNSLARIVNDGRVVKSPTLEEVELDFRQAVPLPDEEAGEGVLQGEDSVPESPVNEDFNRALRYFEMHSGKSPTFNEVRVNLTREDPLMYAGKKAVVEEPARKITVDKRCPGCDERCDEHDELCEKRGRHRHGLVRKSASEDGLVDSSVIKDLEENSSVPSKSKRRQYESLQSTKRLSAEVDLSRSVKSEEKGSSVSSPHARLQSERPKSAEKLDDNPKSKDLSTFQVRRTKFEGKQSENRDTSPVKSNASYETTYTKRLISPPNSKDLDPEVVDEEEDEDEYEFGSSVTVNSKNLSPPSDDRRNISNVSVSSGENSEDSGLVRESIDYTPQDHPENRPPLPTTPMPQGNASQKMRYIMEIKVSPTREHRVLEENEETVESNGPRKSEITVTSNGKATAGKKPPVPPRRSDIAKTVKNEQPDKQVVYVSEYKSNSGKDQSADHTPLEIRQTDTANKKFEHWIFLNENKEQNPWGNGSSQSQAVTNIMLSSGDDKISKQ